jgi:hypothetical protein
MIALAVTALVLTLSHGVALAGDVEWPVGLILTTSGLSI